MGWEDEATLNAPKERIYAIVCEGMEWFKLLDNEGLNPPKFGIEHSAFGFNRNEYGNANDNSSIVPSTPTWSRTTGLPSEVQQKFVRSQKGELVDIRPTGNNASRYTKYNFSHMTTFEMVEKTADKVCFSVVQKFGVKRDMTTAIMIGSDETNQQDYEIMHFIWLSVVPVDAQRCNLKVEGSFVPWQYVSERAAAHQSAYKKAMCWFYGSFACLMCCACYPLYNKAKQVDRDPFSIWADKTQSVVDVFVFLGMYVAQVNFAAAPMVAQQPMMPTQQAAAAPPYGSDNSVEMMPVASQLTPEQAATRATLAGAGVTEAGLLMLAKENMLNESMLKTLLTNDKLESSLKPIGISVGDIILIEGVAKKF